MSDVAKVNGCLAAAVEHNLSVVFTFGCCVLCQIVPVIKVSYDNFHTAEEMAERIAAECVLLRLLWLAQCWSFIVLCTTHVHLVC